MKKVLHYKTNFLNASETFIHRLISAHRDFEPFGLCMHKKLFSDDFHVYEVPARGTKNITNRLAFALNISLPYYKQILRQLRPDIIHAHFGFDGYKLLSLSQKLDIPLVVSFYGSDVSRLPAEFGWKRRYRKMAASNSRFIAASAFMKQQLLDLGFPEKQVEVIRFGFNLDQIPFKQTNPFDKPIMLAGRLVEKKGFRYALEAIQLLKKRGQVVRAAIFGDGPLRRQLADLAVTLGISDQITFKGFISIDEMMNQHQHHSLLLAPSVQAKDGDMEGLPNTILEAMAAGTPVITTRHAAIPEAVIHGTTGFLADEKNAGQLAEIIERVFSQKYDIESIRKNARKKIETEYNIRNIAGQAEALYKLMLA